MFVFSFSTSDNELFFSSTMNFITYKYKFT